MVEVQEVPVAASMARNSRLGGCSRPADQMTSHLVSYSDWTVRWGPHYYDSQDKRPGISHPTSYPEVIMIDSRKKSVFTAPANTEQS